MTTFLRSDGHPIRMVPGFRERVLAARVSTTPRPHWTREQYAVAAEKKLRRARQIGVQLEQRYGRLDGAAVLDLGCGNGINCLVLAQLLGARAVGVDLALPLFESTATGEQTRQLASLVLARLDLAMSLAVGPQKLPARFVRGDATAMPFRDHSFDVLLSRSVMEHITPVERALCEMARVVRPGGVIHHSIDPYYWVRGCHKRGLVDIPWAHARLSLDDLRRFVTQSEGEVVAAERCRRLETLNRLTLAQWRSVIEAAPVEIVEWTEDPSELSVALLEEHPDVLDSLLDGVERRDILSGRLEIWLRPRP